MKPGFFAIAQALSSANDSVPHRCQRVTALLLIAGMIGCSTPTSPTVSLAGATAMLPAPDAVIASSQQVTLTVQNAIVTQPGIPVTLTFEVATDPTFTTNIVTKVVPQSAGGQTSVTLPYHPSVTLPYWPAWPPASYYWHVRASAGGAEVTSGTHTFRIAAVLPTPDLISPVNGVLIGDNRPVTLTVRNGPMPPTVTAITATFEVATDPGFTTIVASTSVPQTMGNETTVTLAALPSRATYYWRVRTEATGAIGAISETASFRSASTPCDAECPYRLSIDGSGNDCRAPILPTAKFQFDGTLTNEGRTRVFSQPPWRAPRGTSTGDLHLRWTPMSSGAVTGSLVLNGARPTNFRDIRIWDAIQEVTTGNLGPGCCFEASALDVAGRVSGDGSVSGTFAGTLDLHDSNFSSTCSGTFPWTLTSRE
jgi:hypothetical protein